jgi:L-threonylcarbamoyladenylate synthase
MSSEIQKATEILRAGGLVAFPTETVYGLGADATNPLAVARVFEAKRRPSFDPLIVHVAGLDAAARLAASFPDAAKRLALRFWPGPLTLVLPKTSSIPDIVTAGLPSVALRVPDHPLALELLRETGRPLAAPSANLFGTVSPTTAAHVRDGLGGLVDLLLDGGPCRVGVESTVLSLMTDPPVLLRPGGVPLEEIRSVIGEVSTSPPSGNIPLAPGQLRDHYATRTPLYLGAAPEAARRGFLGLRMPPEPDRYERIEILAEGGDLRQAAANLFAAMRRLDAAGLDLIEAEPAPEEGLGRAINDRLFKASRKTSNKA